jgi:hypothetical protein
LTIVFPAPTRKRICLESALTVFSFSILTAFWFNRIVWLFFEFLSKTTSAVVPAGTSASIIETHCFVFAGLV